MAITRHRDINCDGCSAWFDGDPINLIGTNSTYGVTDSKKVVELTYFWLCGDCAPEYPNGAKDFFVADYFENIPLCENCGDEEVEEQGYFCDYCNDLTARLENEPNENAVQADADALASAGWGTDEDYA